MAGTLTRLQPSVRACAVLLPLAIGAGPVPRKPKTGPGADCPGF
jgi:hypothetical protein